LSPTLKGLPLRDKKGGKLHVVIRYKDFDKGLFARKMCNDAFFMPLKILAVTISPLQSRR
jgi:hypothetical protein